MKRRTWIKRKPGKDRAHEWNGSRLQRKLKRAAYLLTAGLIVEGITLFWAHPTSFLLFLSLGGILVLAGIVTYLIAIVGHDPHGRRGMKP
jgi:hypothetical protein